MATRAKSSISAPRLAFSIDEAAASIGVGETIFRKHVLPRIRTVRIGARVLISMRELERFLDESSSVLLASDLDRLTRA
jgi:hypothetical protein